MKLSTAQNDRVAGVLLGMAAGDSLGAGYEFGPALADETPVGMIGGGLGWEPGEWTDDTSMAIPIAREAAAGHDPRDEAALDRIAADWVNWARTANDVGTQIRTVFRAAGAPTAASLRDAAAAYTARTERSSGNGSLMRTAPVALAYLDDADGLVDAATVLSQLTHPHPDAVEACVIWSLGIRHAVLHGSFDGVRQALDRLPADRADVWAARLDEAEHNPPAYFDRNGWVVQALQGAWSAITRTPVPEPDPALEQYPCDHLRLSLEAAVRGGRDTDTVAAIAGGLLGARWGASAVPAPWRRVMHGWPDVRSRDLVSLAAIAANSNETDAASWPTPAPIDYSVYGETMMLAAHPNDPGVLLGGVGSFESLPDGVDAIVSLCRVAPAPAGIAPENYVEVRLVDGGLAENPNLGFVLADAADAVAAFRAEGKTVLLHCVQAFSSTPAVAALYAARHRRVRVETALTEIHRLAAGFVRAISFPAAASPSLRDATCAIRVIEAIQKACETGNSQSVEDA